MQNNNFAATLASVASEFGVEDTAKHGRGIKPSKRLYFCWTEEQLEQLTALWDTTSRTCERATVCRYAIRSSTAATAPDRPVSRSFWSARGTGSQAEAAVCAYFQRPRRPAADRRLLRYVCQRDRQLLPV